MARHKGYAPEQIVLGKSTKLPGSLTGDEDMSAHAYQDGVPETSKFHEVLSRRTEARIAFLDADNHQSIRRAMLRRSCPVRCPFMPGQAAMYWFRRPIHGQSTVWLSHQNRIIRCPPENIRPMSLREWNIQERPQREQKSHGNRNPTVHQSPWKPKCAFVTFGLHRQGKQHQTRKTLVF